MKRRTKKQQRQLNNGLKGLVLLLAAGTYFSTQDISLSIIIVFLAIFMILAISLFQFQREKEKEASSTAAIIFPNVETQRISLETNLPNLLIKRLIKRLGGKDLIPFLRYSC